MKKFNKARQRGARRQQMARFSGVGKILTLLSRAGHTEQVESVVAGFYPQDLLVNSKNL